MTTPKKITANQLNSKKSSGPTTTNGKRHSSKNATKHGLFCKSGSFSAEDQIEFDAILSRLEAELRPSSTLLHHAAADIARCLLRCEIAHRLEARTTDALLSGNEDAGEEGSPQPAAWYGSSRGELRTARSWLMDVIADFAEYHLIRPEWKATFDRLFGPAFYESLTQWQSIHEDDINMAVMLTAKARAFNMKLPGLEEFNKTERVVADPRQNEHLKEKILVIQLRHIDDMIRTSQQTAQTANSGIGDFSPRYFTTTQRDLHRAITFFWTLTRLEKEK